MSTFGHGASATPSPARFTAPPDLQLAGIDEASMNSSQEGIPVPVLFGEGAVALHWISTIYNQYKEKAPDDARGKK